MCHKADVDFSTPLDTEHSFDLVAGLITSATITSVVQYSRDTIPSFKMDLIKLYLLSMCLHRCLLTGFLAKAIVLWLSSYTAVGVYL